MGAWQPRLRAQHLLLLALLAGALLVQHVEAQKGGNNSNGNGGGNGAQGGDAAPPPKRRNNRKRPPPPSPEDPLASAPAPAPAESPPPPPPPSPPPSPPPINPDDTMKLILKVEGGPYPLTEDQLQGAMYAINNYTTPVLFTARWQQPSAPGFLPQVQNNVTVYPPPPPPHKKHNNNGKGKNNNGGNGGGDNNSGTANATTATGNRRLRRMLLAMEASRRLMQATGDATDAWWPQLQIPTPIDVDGVYVFADAQAVGVQQAATQRTLEQATTEGLICDALNNNGVTCNTAVIAAQGIGTGPITVYAGAATPAQDGAGTTSSSGLSTAALVGICVGAGVGAIILGVVVWLLVGCRRERSINRAAALRTKSRREEAVPDEESRWRQMYSARMAESMRRAEEATARQQAQSRGPSFIEAQEKALAEESAFEEKHSYGRGGPRTPGSTEMSSAVKLDRESPDLSLMSGSELSSPQPSVASSGRKKSFRRLFSSGGK